MSQGIIDERRDVTLGGWIGHPDIAEIMANAGFDWLVFETEHAPLNLATVQTQLEAINGTNVTPMIRELPTFYLRSLPAFMHGP